MENGGEITISNELFVTIKALHINVLDISAWKSVANLIEGKICPLAHNLNIVLFLNKQRKETWVSL
jgi:hypothetical protein